MRLLRRLRGTSLLTRFATLSLLMTIAVGVVLSGLLGTVIEDRARQQAEDAALMAVRLGLQPQFSRTDLAGGFPASRLIDVEEVVDAASDQFGTAGETLAAFDPIELKIFGRDRTILYHSESTELVGEVSQSGELGAALDGYVVSGFAHSADDGAGSEDGDHRLLEVYVPLQYEGVADPAGAVELYLPYAPVAAAVRNDVRTMTIALGVGLALFYLVVFRLIASASKKLRRQAEALQTSAERDRHQSTHDALTGLPNWVLLQDRLQQSLAAASRSRGEVALLLIDLDRFKEINDSLGHSYGDKLLRQVGPRLRSVLRDADTVGRLGGDEFAVVLPSVDGVGEAEAVAERLRQALHQPFDVDGVILDVEASIGIVLSPWHGTDGEELLRNADIAMYAAKELKGGAVVFQPEVHATTPIRLTVLGDLRRALESTTSCSCTTSPRSPSTASGSRASRRCCAGSTRPRGSSRPASSSRSRRAPASSCA